MKLFKYVLIASTLFFASINNANDASFFFTPAGSQLDGDPIKDIFARPGDSISFTTGIDPSGLTFLPTTTKIVVSYNARWDNSELVFTEGGQQFPGQSGFDGIASDFDLTGTCLRGCSPLDFIVTNPVNNGIVDFGYILGGVSETYTNDPNPAFITDQFSPNRFNAVRTAGTEYHQVVEVQVPGPLPILGITAVFSYSQKLRKRFKSRKSPELTSAIG